LYGKGGEREEEEGGGGDGTKGKRFPGLSEGGRMKKEDVVTKDVREEGGRDIRYSFQVHW